MGVASPTIDQTERERKMNKPSGCTYVIAFVGLAGVDVVFLLWRSWVAWVHESDLAMTVWGAVLTPLFALLVGWLFRGIFA